MMIRRKESISKHVPIRFKKDDACQIDCSRRELIKSEMLGKNASMQIHGNSLDYHNNAISSLFFLYLL
jgi:hypothetical protein